MTRAVAEFQAALAGLARDVQGKVDRLVPVLGRLAKSESLAFITDAYPELIEPYLAAIGDLTATWYEDQAPESSYQATTIALPERDRIAASGRWAMLQTAPADALGGDAVRKLFDASRETVASNAKIEGVKWARHASANACGFCRLLATLGAFYSTEEKALGLRHLDAQGHNHCHCIAVPVRSGTYTPPAYVEQWKRDYRAARANGARTPGQIANEMDYAEGGRRYNPDKPRKSRGPRADGAPAPVPPAAPAAVKPDRRGAKAQVAKRLLPGLEKSLADLREKGLPEDSPQIQYHRQQIDKLKGDIAAAESSGGSKPPTKPPTGGQSVQGDDADNWSAEERGRRQKALGIEAHGEQLTQHEIEFIERFQAAGHQLEWIPRNRGFKPTNDFIWINNDGREYELKSTKARYETIHGRIVDAASRAAKQGVTKDHFVIDIGNEPLTDDLRNRLSGFNVDRRKYRAASLWVMAQGELHEIALAN